MPAIQVKLTSDFINTAGVVFEGKAERGDIYTPLILIFVFIAYQCLSYDFCMRFIEAKAGFKLQKALRTAVLDKRAGLEYKHIEDNEVWDLINRASGDITGRINQGFGNITQLADIAIRIASILFILMTQVWWTGVVITLVCTPLFFTAAKGGKETYQANKEAQKIRRRSDYYGLVLAGRENAEERVMFGYTEKLNKNWLGKYEQARKINLKIDLKYFIRMKLSSLITVIISLFIIGIMLIPLSTGQMNYGLFAGLVGASLNLVQMMSWQLSWLLRDISNNKEYLKDLNNFVKLSEKDGSLDLPVDGNKLVFESLEFKNVSFKYPSTDRYILKNLNMRLEKDIHYAFVGINGAGKTTITKILTGLYDNYEGDILLNGKDLREYSHAELKGYFSVVYQDFAKYFVSMRENISYGNVLEYDEEKLKQNASEAGLDSALEKLKNGLETPLGKIREEGVDLSGGEWQRVAIARALYNPACVRILDEPTASLDPVAESTVYEMFGKVSKGKSTIFITHRLGAAALADEIIVINDGAVAEQGSHAELLKQGGIYEEMFESQRSWYK